MLKTLMLLTTLSLGSAFAQTTTAPASTTQGRTPQSTQLINREQLQMLQTFLQQGGTISLLDGQGNVIGTVNADSNASLQDSHTLADVKGATVTKPDHTTQTVTFTRDLTSKSAAHSTRPQRHPQSGNDWE